MSNRFFTQVERHDPRRARAAFAETQQWANTFLNQMQAAKLLGP